MDEDGATCAGRGFLDQTLPPLREALAGTRSAVLVAPPGAGKTTLIPPALLGEPWLRGGKVLLLEPRRLAARAAALRMAELLGEGDVGGTVGYRMRLDTRIGPGTRIEVLTEGILTRVIQSDPSLDGVGLVIFDEFHERSLHADTGLAMALHARGLLREDLRVLVMSATLDAAPVAELLGGAGVIEYRGTSHPVETIWRDRPMTGHLETAVADTVLEALARHTGSVLAFLPGVGEIRRTGELLGGALPPDTDLFELFGMLPKEVQDRALRPPAPGRRKVVLSSGIAESSLTIAGVRVVVDGGRMRVPRFHAGTGMTRLETVRVTQDAADQRRGRAGRGAPGVCYRLWTRAEEAGMVPARAPEIREAELAPLVLEVAAFGARPEELRWLDPPPRPSLAQARELLWELGALDRAGGLTEHGRRMSETGLHPRLAHLVVRGAERGAGEVACELAALLEERDVLKLEGGGAHVRGLPSALELRLDALREGRRGGPPGTTVDMAALSRVREQASALRGRLGLERGRRVGGGEAGEGAPGSIGVLVALAYPDRVAQLRPGTRGRYLLRNGRGGVMEEADPLAGEPWLAVAAMDARGGDGRIFLAAPVSADSVEEEFADQVESKDEIIWDDVAGKVQARRVRRLGALTLRETALSNPDPNAVTSALCDGVRRRGLHGLAWSREATQLRERLAFLRALEGPAWPDTGDGALLDSLDQWLAPFLGGARSLDDLARVDPGEALLALVPRGRRGDLDRLAPTHLEAPSGSRIRVEYADPSAPVLAVRLQELFGMVETPTVGGGSVPVVVHLLSPAYRPVQVTRDLASFWRGAYFDVRRDLRGRYPKHHWPEDPLSAEPTRRTKGRGGR